MVNLSAVIRKPLDFWRRRWMSTGRRRATFQYIHDANQWCGDESRSGIGSSLAQTEAIRAALPDLIDAFDITSVLDIPCGDFHWMQHVDLRGATYIGIDIIEDLIAGNDDRFDAPERSFLTLDIVKRAPPQTDLIFCRDLLVHFSFADIKRTIANFKRCGATYLLTTTFPERTRNKDIVTGYWRMLNLQHPPFGFPEPIRLINENCTEADGAFRDKSLGLWKLDDI